MTWDFESDQFETSINNFETRSCSEEELGLLENQGSNYYEIFSESRPVI